MTLKQEIEATIQAYEEACKLKNLNLKYCLDNYISYGMCFYCELSKYFKLKNILKDKYYFHFICEIPDDIFYQKYLPFKKLRLYRAHQTRLQYLRNLLTTISNDSDN